MYLTRAECKNILDALSYQSKAYREYNYGPFLNEEDRQKSLKWRAERKAKDERLEEKLRKERDKRRKK